MSVITSHHLSSFSNTHVPNPSIVFETAEFCQINTVGVYTQNYILHIPTQSIYIYRNHCGGAQLATAQMVFFFNRTFAIIVTDTLAPISFINDPQGKSSSQVELVGAYCWWLPSLELTASLPLKIGHPPSQRETIVFQPSIFRGDVMLVSRRVRVFWDHQQNGDGLKELRVIYIGLDGSIGWSS